MLAKSLFALLAAAMVAAAPLDAPEIDERSIEERAICSGTLIDGPRSILDGKGTLYTYYSTANGGTNCAYVNNNTGKQTYMSITLDDTTDCKRSDSDSGSFYQYAGKVSLPGMATHCMQVRVTIDGQSWASMRGWHCGGGTTCRQVKPPCRKGENCVV